MEKEKIEAKARKMFPIGTKFFPAHMLDSFESNKEKYCINTNNNFQWEGSDLFINTNDNKTWDSFKTKKYGNTNWYRVVYRSSNNTFAKIISTSNKNYELWEK